MTVAGGRPKGNAKGEVAVSKSQGNRKARSPGRPSQRGKSVEEVVAFALSHRLRVEILTLLNEGTYSGHELAKLIGEVYGNVIYHIRELADAGSIELAKTEKVRSVDRHYYRAVEMPFFSDEEVAAMTEQQRQVTAALIIQCSQAELMAALWAGKFHSDPEVWLSWRWFNVDAEGRKAIAEKQAQFWKQMQEIEAEATNRRAISGEDSTPIVVAMYGFERARSAPVPPADLD